MEAAAGEDTRKLDQTPTWAVALVCAVIIIISLLLEKGLHHVGEWFTKKNKKALFDALEKVKSELMILGFISLLLTFSQNYVAKICIPESAGNTMLPCKLQVKNAYETPKNRRLLWAELMDLSSYRRILASDATTSCSSGKVPLISANGIQQLHILIFFLAVVHVAYSATTMALGRAKIRSWKEWENETQSLTYEFSTDSSRFRFTEETSFVRQHASFWSRTVILLYIVSFFKQFFRSVRKTDYLTLRHGFITAHLSPKNKFNFREYIKRNLEDDFNVIVGISPVLWACAVVILLLNVHGYKELFWVTLLPLVVILAVGTKLQAIIAHMAVEIQEKHVVIQGIPVVKLSDQHFWFGKPRLVLFLIHFSLFLNAYQLTYFFWIWYMFSLRSCFHEGFIFVIVRICIGVGVHLLCSYITLPLYALVSQMGSHIKMSIFNEQISMALKRWRDTARRNRKNGTPHSRSISPSPIQSPTALPLRSREMFKYETMGHTTDGRDAIRRSHSDTDISDSEMQEVRLDVREGRLDQDEFSFAKIG
ncbi:hypothetical protein LUZ60_014563 [Juncus effusus]|nr:hypothetical protein LUZ60_014563 [Juncus effusus]